MTGTSVGTRDTRSQIITKVLKSYAYETTSGIFISSLGMKIVNVLNDYCPNLVSVDLTKTFQERIVEVGQGKPVEDVLAEGRKVVTELIETMLNHREEIQKLL